MRMLRDLRVISVSMKAAVLVLILGLIWDLTRDERTKIAEEAGEERREIVLACRADGARAVHAALASGHSGLRLLDRAGEVVAGTDTQVSFDYLLAEASWSRSGEEMALFLIDRKRIGIWKPASASMVWLDPDGWLATGYAFSPDGKSLAFAATLKTSPT
jgi:hypothetical protein